MELNDLRRQWQQAPLPPPTPPAQLAGLLGRTPSSFIDRMRRNTWYEILAAPLLGLLPLLVAPRGGYTWVYLLVMLPLLAIMGFYYARQLRLLRQMGQADASMHQHLQVLCQGLRQLLAFYYRLTYWSAVPAFLLVMGYTIWKELHRPLGHHWLTLGLVIGVGLLLGVWLQWGILRFTRQYLQRLYGQHLDRLEGQLRELDDHEPPASDSSAPDFTG